MRAVAIACMAATVSGCLGSITEAPDLMIRGLTYEDLACNDTVPLTFIVENAGDAIAEAVVATIAGGREDVGYEVGNLAPAALRTVNVDIEVRDVCGEIDLYEIIVRARPANGDYAEAILTIDV